MRGGKREGAGRKPGSTLKPRTVLKQQRWTETEWSEVLRRSKEAGICPSDYIRGKALKGE
jgi:hypothetical protein